MSDTKYVKRTRPSGELIQDLMTLGINFEFTGENSKFQLTTTIDGVTFKLIATLHDVETTEAFEKAITRKMEAHPCNVSLN
jgi:hypothetical protein